MTLLGKLLITSAVTSAALLAVSIIFRQERLGTIATVCLMVSSVALVARARWRANAVGSGAVPEGDDLSVQPDDSNGATS
jgi:hypothetical protein